MVTNSTDANYRVRDWIGFYAGYQYTHRWVNTIEGFSLPAFANSTESASYLNTNSLSSGTVGVRLRPVKNLTVNLEGRSRTGGQSADAGKRPQLSYAERAG